MTRKLRLKDNPPQWLCDWLLSQGYAEEVSEEEAPADELRALLPNEVDYVQGKQTGPRTDRPE